MSNVIDNEKIKNFIEFIEVELTPENISKLNKDEEDLLLLDLEMVLEGIKNVLVSSIK